MRSFRILRENQRYLWIMMILFLAGIVMGIAFHTELTRFIEPQLDHLKSVAGDINEKNNAMYTSFRIFVNNFEVGVIYTPLLGILFGLFPMFMITTNGLIIGYILIGLSINKHLSMLKVLLIGILPHGILEIPALVFSAAMAVKLGLKVIRPIEGYSRGQSIGIVAKEYVPVLGLVVIMLAVAALIEGNITPVLMRHFLS
jgi:stage II sporulation protein M